MKAKDFDKKFDDGEDVSDLLDLSTARRLGYEPKKIDIDFPLRVIEALEQEAARVGVSREAIIKIWISERIDQETKERKKQIG